MMKNSWLCPYCFREVRGNEVLFLDEQGEKRIDIKAMEFYYQFEGLLPEAIKEISIVNPREFEASDFQKTKIGFFKTLGNLYQRICPYCHHHLDVVAGEKKAIHFSILMSEQNLETNFNSIFEFVAAFCKERYSQSQGSYMEYSDFSKHYLKIIRLDLEDVLVFITAIKVGINREMIFSEDLSLLLTRQLSHSAGLLVFLDEIQLNRLSIANVENQINCLYKYGASHLENQKFKTPSIICFDVGDYNTQNRKNGNSPEQFASHIYQNIRGIFQSYEIIYETHQEKICQFMENIIEEEGRGKLWNLKI